MTLSPCGLTPLTDGTCGRWNCAPCHPVFDLPTELVRAHERSDNLLMAAGTLAGRQQAVRDFLAWLPGAGAKLVNEVGMDIEGARAEKLVQRFLMERP